MKIKSPGFKIGIAFEIYRIYIKEWKNGKNASLCSAIIPNLNVAGCGQAQHITKQKTRQNIRLDVETVIITR
jgi:hypothetical protein